MVKRTSALLPLALAGALALTACGSDDNNSASSSSTTAGSGSSSTSGGSAADCVSGSLSGAGSSFQAPMEQAWIASFGCKDAKVDYQSVGSGAGIQQFGQGTIDFAGSDVVMKPEEQSAADKTCGSTAIHIPVTAGGIGVTYNLDGVTDLKLSAKTLADIFQGKVKTWNDPEIATDNSGATLPSTPITVFYRNDSSGSTSVFSSYLDAASGGAWTLGTGKDLQWPTGTGAKGSEGVSGGVTQTKGGITYVEQAYASKNNLPTAQIGASGTFAPLNSDTVSKALDTATVSGSGNNVTLKLNFTQTGADIYPISTVSYVITCSTVKDATKAKLLRSYLTYALGDGQSQAGGLGFAPLPASVGDKAKAAAAGIGG